jgi:hypothetical protein
MFDATLGRFLQRDPTDFEGGDINVYNYGGGSPTNDTDPLGEKTVIKQTGNSAANCKIEVTTYINFQGTEANEANAKKIKETIETAWNKGFRYYCCLVVFKIDYKIVPKKALAEGGLDALKAREAQQQMKADERPDPDVITLEKKGYSVTRGKEGRHDIVHSGDWFTEDTAGKYDLDWVPAHEYSHLLGLVDKYVKVEEGGGRFHTVPEKGWENNVLGDERKPVEQRNITDFLDAAVLREKEGTLKNYCCLKTIAGVIGLAGAGPTGVLPALGVAGLPGFR